MVSQQMHKATGRPGRQWTRYLHGLVGSVVLLAAGACGSKGVPKGHAVRLNNGLAAVPDVDPQISAAAPATVAPNPTAPPGGSWHWTAAPLLQNVTVVLGRDSVVLGVPVVNGAADFRVFALDGSVAVTAAGSSESVAHADIYCAGDRQFNAPAPASPQVMQSIEVFNLTKPTALVIEAIDRNCPFPGIRGSTAFTETINCADVQAQDCVPEAFYTEAQMRPNYADSLIFNGHGPAAQLAAPAPNDDPVVLQRTTVLVTPTGNSAPELAYFDDFSDTSDQPQFVQNEATFSDRNSNAQLLQNSRWNFYQVNYDQAEILLDRGQLQMNLIDRYQQTFGSNFMVPRRSMQISATDYLHVSYTVNSDATQRRYWWMFLCGSGTPGKTIDAEGEILGNIVNTPFFYQPDGLNPSVENWTCLQIFPRDGWPYPLPPSNQRPQSDIRVMLNEGGAPVRNDVVNLSPAQYGSQAGDSLAPSWYRTQAAGGTLTGPILDDQMTLAPRARYDVYVRQNRVILFVNGQQRLCNDFTAQPLSISEAALGLGQVLYHSTAERYEFSESFNDRTGQRYYLTNTPYADVRSWDNVGYMEHTAAPSYFDASSCYAYVAQ